MCIITVSFTLSPRPAPDGLPALGCGHGVDTDLPQAWSEQTRRSGRLPSLSSCRRQPDESIREAMRSRPGWVVLMTPASVRDGSMTERDGKSHRTQRINSWRSRELVRLDHRLTWSTRWTESIMIDEEASYQGSLRLAMIVLIMSAASVKMALVRYLGIESSVCSPDVSRWRQPGGE